VVTNGLGEGRAEVHVTVHGKGLEVVAGVTSETGELTRGPFPPGVPLRVIASADDGRETSTAAARARDRHDVEVPLVLQRAGRVRGTITDEKGRPIKRARVEISLGDDGPLLGVVRTSADGSFELTGVPSTELRIRASAPGFREQTDDAHMAGGTSRVRMKLKREPSGTLIGFVIGPDGNAVAGALVRLVPADLQVDTGKDGRFKIAGLPAGEAQRILVDAEGLRVAPGSAAGELIVTAEADKRVRVSITMVRAESVDVEPSVEVAASIRAVSGRIVRATGAPVAAARVWWSGTEVITDADGAFRIERGAGAKIVARPLLVIMPPVGLLEPLQLPLHTPNDDGHVELEDVGLRDRPSCVIDVRSTPGTAGFTLAFSLLYDGADRFLGRSLAPFQASTVVTYDGSWLHVAQPAAWRAGGSRRAYVGVTRANGPLVAWADWPVAAGPSMGVQPEWRDSLTKFVLKVPLTHRGAVAQFRLRRAPGGAPLIRMGLPTEFSLRVNRTKILLDPLLRGEWEVVVKPAQAAGGERLTTTIKDGRAPKLAPTR